LEITKDLPDEEVSEKPVPPTRTDATDLRNLIAEVAEVHEGDGDRSDENDSGGDKHDAYYGLDDNMIPPDFSRSSKLIK